MKIEGEIDMINKNGNLQDQTLKIPLQHKSLYSKKLIVNNNSVIVNNNVFHDEGNIAESNDDNNNDYIDRNQKVCYKCPVCHFDEFTSSDFLEDHVKSQHPGFKPTCEDCGELFSSLKLLAIHSAMHVTEKCAIRSDQINLKILNYLESKNSFYQKLNESIETSQNYRCNFCGEHFSGAQFMVHWKQCKRFRSEDYEKRDDSESEDTKNNFLAGLNLQSCIDSRTSSDCESNRSSSRSERVDIDSKVSSSKLIDVIQNAAAYPKHPMFFVDEEKNPDDDDNDPFKVEVRDMKRRGEFPCRICKKIFRNLRALKGHARIHISGNRGVRPYECNICSFTTTDKSVVIRHIRNHNGDHPYKCQLCFSTFTTKANCERHLRNAHRKTSREDIKKLLVDLNNKPQSSNATHFKTKLQSLLTAGTLIKNEKDEYPSPKFSSNEFCKARNENVEDDSKSMPSTRERSDADESSNSNDSNNNTNSVMSRGKKQEEYPLSSPQLLKSGVKYPNFHVAGLLDMRMSRPEKQFYEVNYKTYNEAIMGTGLVPTMIRDNGFVRGQPYGRHFLEPESDTDEPLDLSVDVLDLSKKNNDSAEINSNAEDLSLRNRNYDQTLSTNNNQSSRTYFDKTDVHYNFSNTIIPNLSSLFVPTVSMNTFPQKIDSEEESDTPVSLHNMKIRPLIFGQLVTNAAERYEDIRQNVTAYMDFSKQSESSSKKPEDKSDECFESGKFRESQKSRNSKSSTVKMVMKDGVLVEKQKQRRYRTEKPFSCAYCSGRFTLRSNMDRHVKQQHPGFWRQRQRGGSNRSQKPKPKDESSPEVISNMNVESQMSLGESVSGLDTLRSIEKGSHESDVEVDVDDDYGAVKKGKKDDGSDHCEDDDDDEEELVIDEELQEDPVQVDEKNDCSTNPGLQKVTTKEENPDLASVRSLLDNVSTQTFSQYFRNEDDPTNKVDDGSDDDEEGLVAGSSSEGNGSGGEERSALEASLKASDKSSDGNKKKKSAYSSAPNRVHCDFCYRSFPWASSLRRHTLTHTGQKPYKCSNCPLLFTTKSNCDRHFLRKHRNQLSELQPTAVANVTPISGVDSERSSAARLIPNFSTRNVPERPFKCNHCPSSTFSTFQNLKRHIIEKHNQAEVTKNEEPTTVIQSEQSKSKKEETLHNTSDNSDVSEKSVAEEKEGKSQLLNSSDQSFSNHVASDLPFKCHLCDRSFGDRQEALDHMGESHSVEFQHLICKGALDMTVKLEDTINHDDAIFANSVHSDENNGEQCRGRFPDYSSRKVICAFCLRRFWSAEDLRRHMRTHTGERPFACDICQRRFTLKHSMLRHRKKHSNKSFASTSGENSPNTDDEEPSSPYDNRTLQTLPLVADRNLDSLSANCKQTKEFESAEKKLESLATPLFSATKELSKVCNKSSKEDGVDLIAKLLDIDDKELVDEMLTSKSADDVAKLLGVQK